MYRYCAWEFNSKQSATRAHTKLLSKSQGYPVSVTRIEDLVVVICDNRNAYRMAKRQKLDDGWRVSLPDEIVEAFIERRRKVAPIGADKFKRILTLEDGSQISWMES